MQGPIGFIGLGIMGRPMAKNLLKAGHAVVVHNRSQAAVQELAGLGAKTADSPAAVARAAGRPDHHDAAELPRRRAGRPGPEGAARGRPVRPDPRGHVHDLADRLPEGRAALGQKGVKMLDAPVSGGEKGAIEGILSIMVGGEPAVFQQVLPGLPGDGEDDHAPRPARGRRLHEARQPDHRGGQPDGARRGADAGGQGRARHRADAQGARRGPRRVALPRPEDAELPGARVQARVQDRPPLQGPRADRRRRPGAGRAAPDHRRRAGALQRGAGARAAASSTTRAS